MRNRASSSCVGTTGAFLKRGEKLFVGIVSSHPTGRYILRCFDLAREPLRCPEPRLIGRYRVRLVQTHRRRAPQKGRIGVVFIIRSGLTNCGHRTDLSVSTTVSFRRSHYLEPARSCQNSPPVISRLTTLFRSGR